MGQPPPALSSHRPRRPLPDPLELAPPLCIGFIPFPTALLAEYLTHPGERVAVIVYSGTFFVTAVVYHILCVVALPRSPPAGAGYDPRVLKSINARYRLGPPAYLVAFIASFLYPPASLVILALLALTYVLPYSAPEG